METHKPFISKICFSPSRGDNSICKTNQMITFQDSGTAPIKSIGFNEEIQQESTNCSKNTTRDLEVGQRHAQSTSPLFEFPSFDELFDGTENVRPILKTLSSFIFKSQEGAGIAKIENGSSAPKFRQDSVMSQDIYTALYTSWEGSNNITEFRCRLGNSLNHKYLSYCRIDDTAFIACYSIYGAFLLCAGIFHVLQCEEDTLINIYLLADGVLSIFIFPILVMNWKTRVGGCVNEPDKVGNGAYWFTLLTIRIIISIFGAIMIPYIKYTNTLSSDTECQVGYYISYATVILEWMFLVIAVFVPSLLFGIAYFIAPVYNTHHREFGSSLDS